MTDAIAADEILGSEDHTATACFEIAEFTSVDELERIWLDLERRAPATFFLSWDWMGCWIAREHRWILSS